MNIPNAEPWMADGACGNSPPDLFYPTSGERWKVSAALAVCAQCPVKAECLDYALSIEVRSYRFGIFGGATPEERQRIHEWRAS